MDTDAPTNITPIETKLQFTFKENITKKAFQFLTITLAQKALEETNCNIVGAHLLQNDFRKPLKGAYGQTAAQAEYLHRAVPFYK